MPLYLSTRFSFFATEYRLSPASQLLSLLPLSSSSLLLFLHLLPPSLGCYISLPVTLTDLMRRGGCNRMLRTSPNSLSQFLSSLISLLPSLYRLSSLFSSPLFSHPSLHHFFSKIIHPVLLLFQSPFLFSALYLCPNCFAKIIRFIWRIRR